MKRLIAVLLSISMILGLSAAYAADKTEINDGLDNAEWVFSASDNILFGQTTSALGDYENPVYATSGVGTMEFVYELDNMAGFEVMTLNYKEFEDIKFYISDDNDEYTAVTEVQRTASELAKNWKKISYSAAVTAKYLKIVIVQEKAKYIRVDNVNVYADVEPELLSYEFFRNEKAIEGQNISGADTLVLHYNQVMEKAPLLISDGSAAPVEVTGEYGESRKDIVYKFEPLLFDIYSFSVSGLQTVTGKTTDFAQTAGMEAVFGLPENLYLSETYKTAEMIKTIVDAEGNEYTPENPVLSISEENQSILKIENENIIPLSGGDAAINVAFEINSEKVQYSYSVHVCAPQSAEILPAKKQMTMGESFDAEVSVLLDDNTYASPSVIQLKSTDETIVKASGKTITAVSKGNAFVSVHAEYYGYSFDRIIAIGVEREPLAAFSEAVLSMNRDELVVGSEAETILSGKSSDGDNVDMTVASCTYYSDDESIVTISSEGRVSANAVGKAAVYADVTVGGITVRTNTLQVTVVNDDLISAALGSNTLYMETGESEEFFVSAATRSGRAIENGYNVKYISENESVAAFTQNKLTAKEAGECSVYAEASYNGKTISTKKYIVKVSEKEGEFSKNFKESKDWSGTLSHTDGLSVSNDGVSLKNGENQYITFKTKDSIATLSLGGMSYGSVSDDDITVWVSTTEDADENYERVPINITTSGSGKLVFTGVNADIIYDAEFLRVYINASTIRLENVDVVYNAAPDVLGVTELTSTGALRGNAMPDMLNIVFSQEIDENSIQEISLSEKNGGKINGISFVCSGKSCKVLFDKLSPEDYVLSVSGVKNKNGLEMNHVFTYDISGKSSEENIVIENISLSANVVSADVINNSEPVRGDILFVIFDANGRAVSVAMEKDYLLSSGNNSIRVNTLAEGAEAKVYVWSSSAIPTVLD